MSLGPCYSATLVLNSQCSTVKSFGYNPYFTSSRIREVAFLGGMCGAHLFTDVNAKYVPYGKLEYWSEVCVQ